MRKHLHNPLHSAIRERLKELRLAAGLSQRELAKQMGCTDNVIVRLENGGRRLDLLEFYLLCKVLNCDVRAVFGQLVDSFEAAETARA